MKSPRELLLFRFCATLCGYGNAAAKWAFIGEQAEDYGSEACLRSWEKLGTVSPTIQFGRYHRHAEWAWMNSPERAPYLNDNYGILIRIKAAYKGIVLTHEELGPYFVREIDQVSGCSFLFLLPLSEGSKELLPRKHYNLIGENKRQVRRTWLPSRRLLLQLIVDQSLGPEVILFYGHKHSRDWLRISKLETMIPIDGLDGLARWGKRDRKLFVAIGAPRLLSPEFPLKLGAWIRKMKDSAT